MFKRGYVYEVVEEGQSMHPVVIMDDRLNKQGRIRAVAFTHDQYGSVDYPNIPFDESFIVKKNSRKKMFQFQWENTKIIQVGFLKRLQLLHHRHIGRITEAGLKYIAENVHVFEECDGSVKKASKKRI